MNTRFIYFADPMCSWCWGFAPVIEAVRARYGHVAPVGLILGGLAPGTKDVLDTAGKDSIRAHWQHVHELAAQPFDFSFFEREDFTYDTAPACRAVVAARRLQPDKAVEFLTHLHRAFYSQNRDITDRATLCDLAAEFGLDGREFEAEFDADETRQETLADFETAKRTGITGFPTLLAGDNKKGYSIITLGYQPWRKVEAMIGSWMDNANIEAPGR